MKESTSVVGFDENLPNTFVRPTDEAGRKLFREYGAVFVARGDTIPPPVVVFQSDSEVSSFQSGLQVGRHAMDGFSMELQAPAMTSLLKAADAARSKGESISPRDSDSARRGYDETVELWKSRVDPALKHWTSNGRLTDAEARRIRGLSPFEQVPEIFRLEAQGMYFSKDLSKSIIYSVAPPGASQHLSMLAFDVKEHDNPTVRSILNEYGWFQTVISDLPHFTFLGVSERELPDLGLKETIDNGRSFWIPNI
ncbi:MAG: hypothetical protein WBD22_10645 [Pyrinomonadaceae bacterium]